MKKLAGKSEKNSSFLKELWELALEIKTGMLEIKTTRNVVTFGVFAAWSFSGFLGLLALGLLAVAGIDYEDSPWSLVAFFPSCASAGLSIAWAIGGLALFFKRDHYESSLSERRIVWMYLRYSLWIGIIFGGLLLISATL